MFLNLICVSNAIKYTSCFCNQYVLRHYAHFIFIFIAQNHKSHCLSGQYNMYRACHHLYLGPPFSREKILKTPHEEPDRMDPPVRTDRHQRDVAYTEQVN